MLNKFSLCVNTSLSGKKMIPQSLEMDVTQDEQVRSPGTKQNAFSDEYEELGSRNENFSYSAITRIKARGQEAGVNGRGSHDYAEVIL